ncbi:MAG: type II toxin-antitoxin system mRNA interferase toxin, RelE/StbE family [Thermodesulfobacteriota bacterium]|nr:type II toxin-antitoxin system mRNA interferase toxin, RelE/StbE family [Thermodesulfobacteriota bacterium]
MKRRLLRSPSFVRAAQRLLRKQPLAATSFHQALTLLAEDAFHPKLRTHKLKGKLQGSWACTAGYDLRIVFDFVPHEEAEAILLVTVGTHEEVY